MYGDTSTQLPRRTHAYCINNEAGERKRICKNVNFRAALYSTFEIESNLPFYEVFFLNESNIILPRKIDLLKRLIKIVLYKRTRQHLNA